MKPIILIASFFVCVTGLLQSATLIFESSLSAPLESGGSLSSGNFFLKVSGDSAEFQIWSGEIADLDFEIQSSDGSIFTRILGDRRSVILSGCDLLPRNPFLPFDPTGFLPLPPISCDALKSYQVYEGFISDPVFIQSIVSGNEFSVSFDIADTWTSSPATGTLNQVPEPSSLVLVTLALFPILRRNRNCRTYREM